MKWLYIHNVRVLTCVDDSCIPILYLSLEQLIGSILEYPDNFCTIYYHFSDWNRHSCLEC
jgi:hypothetical protein